GQVELHHRHDHAGRRRVRALDALVEGGLDGPPRASPRRDCAGGAGARGVEFTRRGVAPPFRCLPPTTGFRRRSGRSERGIYSEGGCAPLPMPPPNNRIAPAEPALGAWNLRRRRPGAFLAERGTDPLGEALGERGGLGASAERVDLTERRGELPRD